MHFFSTRARLAFTLEVKKSRGLNELIMNAYLRFLLKPAHAFPSLALQWSLPPTVERTHQSIMHGRTCCTGLPAQKGQAKK